MSKKANDAQDAIAGKHQSLAARIRQLTVKLEDKENENTELQDSVTSLQGELESTRLDCGGMLKVLSNMEKQLTEYTSREENVAAVGISIPCRAELTSRSWRRVVRVKWKKLCWIETRQRHARPKPGKKLHIFSSKRRWMR